jgi:hypothetical protein
MVRLCTQQLMRHNHQHRSAGGNTEC